MITSLERSKAEKAYKKAHEIKQAILSKTNLQSLYKTDHAKYLKYRRCCKKIEDIKRSGVLTTEFFYDYHQSVIYCKNCLRKQSEFLMETYNDQYSLQFFRVRSDEIARRIKFRRFLCSKTNVFSFSLCQECWNYLNPDIDSKTANSSENTWPAFVCTTLSNSEAFKIYGLKLWQLIPRIWRYWWIDTLPLFLPEYSSISIYAPPPLFHDRSCEIVDWKTKISSQSLPQIAQACNKYMMPCVLCPWGCSEYIFHAGHVSLDIVFQRYLMKVKIQLIHDISVMKYIRHSRDDFVRWSGVYDCWLLNPNWAVTPSFNFIKGKGMQVMVCKDHNSGHPHLCIHPIRQPGHILPCKFSDQMTHAVIKPRTITQMKAQLYSNTFQMQEQRGNFNGIDTCSITQYRNFKLISYLLQENESRSIRGRPDINALLDQFVKETLIPAEFAETLRQTAKQVTQHYDIDDLISGGTYVPVEAAIQMQQQEKFTKVILDGINDEIPEQYQTQYMRPVFPSMLYPCQKCDAYGAIPYGIPTYLSTSTNTFMLWALTGLLTRVEEIWKLVSSFELRQSWWHGWMLSYITCKCLTHINIRSSGADPFRMSFMRSVDNLFTKIVSIYGVLYVLLYVFLFLYFNTCSFLLK